MEHAASSSAERTEPVICKTTYLGVQKRKRAQSKSNHDSDSDSSAVSKPPMKTPKKPTAKAAKTPSNKGPKKVEVDLPGPSPPKRVRRDSDASITAPKGSKTSRARPPSSVGSVQQTTQHDADSPPVNKKSESISASFKKPKSKAKSVVADDDNDDNVSVADSSISVNRIRRNANERIEYFKNQPECSSIEPHFAHCNVCKKAVNLGRKQTYAVRPWEIHRARCDERAAQSTPPSPVLNTFIAQAENDQSSSADVTASMTPTQARRPNEIERKEYLESDKQIKALDKDRALCGKCDQWVALSDTHSYVTGNWVKHKEICSDAIPSNRVAAAKRKLLIVNDKQVKSFTSRKIICAVCDATVQLEGDGDYNLTNWDDHKINHCVMDASRPSNGENSVPFPSTGARPPSSSGSTEDTLVVDAQLPKGLKRSREEDETGPQEDERPSARPRTSSYLPPQIEPPNTVMGWFMLPFQSFVRGFKESLKDTK